MEVWEPLGYSNTLGTSRRSFSNLSQTTRAQERSSQSRVAEERKGTRRAILHGYGQCQPRMPNPKRGSWTPSLEALQMVQGWRKKLRQRAAVLLLVEAPLELEQGHVLLQPGWREPGCSLTDFCSLKQDGNTRSYRARKVKGRGLRGVLNTPFIHQTHRNIPYAYNRVLVFFLLKHSATLQLKELISSICMFIICFSLPECLLPETWNLIPLCGQGHGA